MKKIRFFLAGVVALGMAAGVGSAVAVADDAAQAVEARQAVMKTIGGNSRALGAFVKGEGDEGPERAAERAREISDAARQIPEAFEAEHHVENVPDGVETEARPVIWTDQETFRERARDLQEASAELARAADTGDMGEIRSAFAGMTKTCGGCHQSFRVQRN